MNMLSEAELRAIPKVELHLHLDCSMSFASVSALDPGVTPERYRAEFLAPRKCVNLVDYFRYLAPALALLQTREALTVSTIDLLRQLHEDGVVYAEIRFAPQLHRQTGMSTEAVVETVLAALVEGRRSYPVEARLILCQLRPEDTANGLELVRIAQKYRAHGVGGVDLAGDETGYGLGEHIPVFKQARDLGLNITAHAGEAGGAEKVREVVEQLGVRRVGHGVRSIEDDAVIALLLERDVHLEVCPSCNIQIDVFDRYEDHPVDALVRRGVSVGVNTDARGPTDLTLTEEYGRLQQVFGWDAARFRAANLAAIGRAFADDATKAAIRARLEA
jgi:adenosine deaminase